MKRILTLMTALLMVLMLFGCGGSEGAGGGSSLAEFTFAAKDADLSNAPDAILENSPENIGGWLDSRIISFPLKITKEADYEITVEYSRPGPLGRDIYFSNDSTTEGFTSYLDCTSDEDGDWSIYKETVVGTIHLTKDDKALDLMADEELGDHVINLRKLKLKEVPEGQKGAEPITAADGQGGGEPADAGTDYLEGTYSGYLDDDYYDFVFYSDGTFSCTLEDESVSGTYYIEEGTVYLDTEDATLMLYIVDEETLADEDDNYFYLETGGNEDDEPTDEPTDDTGEDYSEQIRGLYVPADNQSYDTNGYYFGGDGFAGLCYEADLPMGATYEIDGSNLKIVGPDYEFIIKDAYTITSSDDGMDYVYLSEDAEPVGTFYNSEDGTTYFEFYSDGYVDFTQGGETLEGVYEVSGQNFRITINDEPVDFIMLNNDVILAESDDGERLYFAKEEVLR